MSRHVESLYHPHPDHSGATSPLDHLASENGNGLLLLDRGVK
jgi:hypothetical protein